MILFLAFQREPVPIPAVFRCQCLGLPLGSVLTGILLGLARHGYVQGKSGGGYGANRSDGKPRRIGAEIASGGAGGSLHGPALRGRIAGTKPE